MKLSRSGFAEGDLDEEKIVFGIVDDLTTRQSSQNSAIVLNRIRRPPARSKLLDAEFSPHQPRAHPHHYDADLLRKVSRGFFDHEGAVPRIIGSGDAPPAGARTIRAITTAVSARPHAAPGQQQTTATQPADVLVVFGITGDLAKVMTLRSLYRLSGAAC